MALRNPIGVQGIPPQLSLRPSLLESWPPGAKSKERVRLLVACKESRHGSTASLGKALCTTFSIFRAGACTGDQPHCDSAYLPGVVTHRPMESGAKALDVERLIAQTLTLVLMLCPHPAKATAQTTHQQKTPSHDQ